MAKKPNIDEIADDFLGKDIIEIEIDEEMDDMDIEEDDEDTMEEDKKIAAQDFIDILKSDEPDADELIDALENLFSFFV